MPGRRTAARVKLDDLLAPGQEVEEWRLLALVAPLVDPRRAARRWFSVNGGRRAQERVNGDGEALTSEQAFRGGRGDEAHYEAGARRVVRDMLAEGRERGRYERLLQHGEPAWKLLPKPAAPQKPAPQRPPAPQAHIGSQAQDAQNGALLAPSPLCGHCPCCQAWRAFLAPLRPG